MIISTVAVVTMVRAPYIGPDNLLILLAVLNLTFWLLRKRSRYEKGPEAGVTIFLEVVCNVLQFCLLILAIYLIYLTVTL